MVMPHRIFIVCWLLVLAEVAVYGQSQDSPAQWLNQLRSAPPDTHRVALLLKLGNYYLYKPEELQPDLDSALMLVREAKALSESLKSDKWIEESNWLLGFCHFERKELLAGRATFKLLADQYRKTGDLSAEAAAWMRMGIQMNRNKYTYEECIRYFQKAIALYRQTGEKELPIVALKEIADVHLNQGKLDESEKELREVIELYKAIGYRNLHYTYDLLAAVSTLKGNMNQALYFALEMIKSMEATGDSSSAATFYHRLGRIYGELGHWEKSIEWYKKSYAKKQGPNYGLCVAIIRGLINLGKAKEALDFINNAIKEGPPKQIIEKAYVASIFGDCYNALGQFDLAERYYLEMIQQERKSQKQNFYTSTVNYTIGAFYVDRNRYQAAAPYLKKVLAIADGIVTVKRLTDTHLLLFKVDSAQGNYFSAIRHFQRHKQLNDSIFSETKSRQIEELQIQYATNKKENDLVMLQNESTLQQSKLQKAQLEKDIIIGGGVLLLLIIGVLYNRFQLKQRINRQLEQQQTEINQTNRTLQLLLQEKERLLREIHHRVKNNLQIVMSLLNSQSAYLDNETALSAIRDSQQRIHSISLIHQKLYQSENSGLIDMSIYIRELVNYLQGSFDTGHSIRFDLQNDAIELDVTQAVPVGLILNEAISNAIKYAFPFKKDGIVTISMQYAEMGDIMLTVSDNGVGLPEAFEIDQCNSLGMSLMRGLSEQLNGKFEMKNHKGLTVSTTFKKEHTIVPVLEQRAWN